MVEIYGLPIAGRKHSRPRRSRRGKLLSITVLGTAVALVAVSWHHVCPLQSTFASSWFVSARPSARGIAPRRTRTFVSKASRERGGKAEEYEFQAEVGRVMDIIVRSLYSNPDVFLRELVSNAADACEKKRFAALTHGGSMSPETLKIRVSADFHKKLLIIEDNGVGMSKDELVGNLGSIARSGTAKFVEALGAGNANVSQIGKFGVGFYSAFLVADDVEVVTKKLAQENGSLHSWRWSSDGRSFRISDAPDETFFGNNSGTKLVLRVKPEAEEYLDSSKLEQLLRRYSEFISFPIELWTDSAPFNPIIPGQVSKKEDAPTFTWNTINTMKPLWIRPPNKVSLSEYNEFYQTVFKAFGEPLSVTHFKVEGQIEFRAMVFIPGDVPFELSRDMFAERGRAMRLYVKQVFINDEFEDLIPRWLAFLRGVVESDDLPLNVGREILQKSRTLEIIRNRIVKKVLETIETMRDSEPDKFVKFSNQYGKYLKVGLVEDVDHREKLKSLVRFWSSAATSDNTTSLSEYVSRMKGGQEQIYFAAGLSRRSVEAAPAMERMRQLGYEVLFAVDPLEEICLQSLVDFDGRPLVDVNKAGLKIEDLEAEDAEAMRDAAKELEQLSTWLQAELGEKVAKVEISSRLVDSAAAIVQGEWGMSPMMQRYMEMQGTTEGNPFQSPSSRPILEINPGHPIVQGLSCALGAGEASTDMASMLYETAALSSGYPIEDPASFARLITKLFGDSLGQRLEG